MRGLRGEARAFFWLTRAVRFCFFGVYLSVFNLYLIRLGYKGSFVGVVLGVAIVATSIGAYVAGRSARAPRSMLIAGQVLSVVAFTAIAITDLLPKAMWTPWLLCADGLGGLGGAMFAVGRLPYLMSITTADNRMTAFVLDQVGGAVAASFGAVAMSFVPAAFASALGTTLDDPAPFRFALLISPLVTTMAVLGFARVGGRRAAGAAGSVEPSHPRAPEAAAGGGAAAEPAEETASGVTALVSTMVIFALLLTLGDSPPQFFFNVYMDKGLHVSPTTIALAIGIARISPIIPILALPALSRRWSYYTLTVALASLLVMVLVPFALIQHEFVAAASYVVFCMIRGTFDSTFEVLRMSLISPRWHKRMASRVQSGIAFSMALAGFASGIISDNFGYRPLFLGAGALVAGSVLLLLAKRSLIGTSRRSL
jgi:MFS family permease